MRTYGRDAERDERHRADRLSGALPHGPASTNPARELSAALHAGVDTDRGRRDRALRALELRGSDPEWRGREDEGAEPDELEAAMAAIVTETRPGGVANGEAQRDLAERPADVEDNAVPPPPRKLGAPGDLDLTWLRPPDDLLLRAPAKDGAGRPESADTNDLDARLPRPPGASDGEEGKRLDHDLLAQGGSRPLLAQKQQADLRPARTDRPRMPEPDRRDPRRRPLPGLTTSEAAKRAAQIQKADQDLTAGPQVDKTPRPATTKKGAAQPVTAGVPPAPKKEPEKKEAERSAPEGEASEGEVGAWQQRQAKKIDAMKVEPVADADRYVATYQKATTRAAQLSPLKKLELLDQAEQKVTPADPPKDLPKLAKPSEFVQAETAVREKADLTLPEQTMPDLAPTPLGNLPEVGMRLKMDEADRQFHIVKETKGPDGKTTTVEFKVVPEDQKPGKDDKVVQVKAPRPSDNLQESVAKLRAAGQKKRLEIKEKGGGKGQKISDDRRMGAPVVPPFARVDVGTVVAKLLAQIPKYTQQVVDEARDAFAHDAKGKIPAEAYIAGEQPVISEELHKVARAANVTDKDLEKKRLQEEAKLKADAAKQHDKKEDAAAKATAAVKTNATGIGGHIGALASSADAHLQEQKTLAEGGSEPDEVKREAKAGKEHIRKLVARWRGEYKRMGVRRKEQLEAAGQKQRDAYGAAAEIDFRQLDVALGIKNKSPKEHQDDDHEQYKPTKTWLKATLKDLHFDVKALVEKASSFAEAYMTEVAAAGDRAFDLIEEWEKRLLEKEKSWWRRFFDWIMSFLTHARKEVRQWDTESTEDNNTNLSKDMIWLERARIYQYHELSKDAIEKGQGFSEEQKAMLLALKASKGRDSAGALAAGLMSRISQQRREGLTKKFENDVMSWGPERWEDVEEVSIGNTPTQAKKFAEMTARKVHNLGEGRSGTDEEGIFRELGGLTKLQGRAVELAYKFFFKRNLRDDLKSELFDWTQQISGSTGDWDRAVALLEGNSARAIAVQIYQAMHETFLGTGLGTDEGTVFKLLKGKSPAEIAAIKREYRAYYGKDLILDAQEELGDQISTAHDFDRFTAIMNNRPDLAQVIEADSAMRGSILGRTDRGGLEQVYKDVAAEVAKEGEKRDWSAERIQRETAVRFASLDTMYEGLYGEDFDPSQRATDKTGKKESAFRTAMRESFTWSTPKAAWNLTTSTGDLDLLLSYHDLGLAKDAPDIKAAWRTHLAESNAARIQIEHRSIFNASDKEIDKALAEQYESAYRDRLRDEKVKVEAERDVDYDRLGKLRAAAEKLKGKAQEAKNEEAKQLETRLNRKWAPEGEAYLTRMRQVRQDARTAAQGDAKVNMAELGSVYEKKYREWNKEFNFGEDKSFQEVVRGDTGWGGWLDARAPGAGQVIDSLRTKDNDKTIALLESGGYLSPEDKLFFAVYPYGSTDEDTAKEVFAEADTTEAQQILTRLGRRLQGRAGQIGPSTAEDEAAAYKLAADWVLDDFSGREYQDQYIAMMGVPHTPAEHLAVGEKKLEFEKNSGPGKFANALPYAAPFGALLLVNPVTAPLGGVLLAGPLLAGAFRSLDADSLSIMEDEVAQLRAAKLEADRLATVEGLQPGDAKYDTAMRQVSLLSDRVNSAMLVHRSEVDAMTDIVTTVVTVIVTVIVIAVSIALSPFTGGASAAAGAALTTLMWTAVIGAVAATLANMAVKYALKGDAYGWEEIGYDAVVGLVEAVASALTAGLGDKFLKAGFLLKMGQSGLLQRIAAHGLANAAEGIVQALPGALAGNVLNDDVYRDGNPFANILLGTVTQVGMASAMSGGMGGLLGGIRKPTHFIRPGTDAYNELWHQYKVKYPSATPDKFRLDLHQRILAGDHPGLGRKQLEQVAREQIVAGLDGDAAKAFKKLKVEVLPADEFARVTRSRELGEAVVMLRRGEPTVVVKAGADFQNLHREAPHLMQTLREDTARLVRKLDESVLAHWDKLPIETQVDLYKTKLALEIDAHQQMLKSLESDKAVRRFGKERWAREVEYAQQTLDNLRKRMKEVDGLDVEAVRARPATRPHYLEEPPRLFTKEARLPPSPGEHVILEPYLGPSVESAIDLARRHPDSLVIAAESRIKPKPEDIERLRAAGGVFVPEHMPSHLPHGSVDEIKMRYPLPHEKALEQDIPRRIGELRAANEKLPIAQRRPVTELYDQAIREATAAAETVPNYAPYALQRLKPGGTLEVVFWEKQIVDDLTQARGHRYVDPMTGKTYRLEVVEIRTAPRVEVAPHSGFGIPADVSDVSVARLRKVEVDAVPAVPTGGRGPHLEAGEAVGPHSGRQYFPERAGGPVRELDYTKIRVTDGGIDVVEAHLRRFNGGGAEELAMVSRLRRIARGEIPATPEDLRFYSHELREYVRYRKLGWREGQPPGRDASNALWNDTHTATLEDYKLHERRTPLYHPSVEGAALPTVPRGAAGPPRIEAPAPFAAAGDAPRLERRVRRALELELSAAGHSSADLRAMPDAELVAAHGRAQVDLAPARIQAFRGTVKAEARLELDALLGSPDRHGQFMDADLGRRVARGIETPVRVGYPGLEPGEVRVHYDVGPLGNVRGVEIRVGAEAKLGDVLLHLPTLHALRRYEGLTGVVRRVVGAVDRLLSGGGRLPLGSRAHEALLELQKLPGVIHARRAQLIGHGLDAGTRVRIELEIASLEKQLAEHVHALSDVSRGRGYVAAKIEVKKEDFAADLERPEVKKALKGRAEVDRYIELRQLVGMDTPTRRLVPYEVGKRADYVFTSDDQVFMALEEKGHKSVPWESLEGNSAAKQLGTTLRDLQHARLEGMPLGAYLRATAYTDPTHPRIILTASNIPEGQYIKERDIIELKDQKLLAVFVGEDGRIVRYQPVNAEMVREALGMPPLGMPKDQFEHVWSERPQDIVAQYDQRLKLEGESVFLIPVKRHPPSERDLAALGAFD